MLCSDAPLEQKSVFAKGASLKRVLDLLERHWKWVVIAVWLAFCITFTVQRWGMIQGFALPDTDDNLRMAQVRALLNGQGWFDLRQYRLNPPIGANIHWSRIVDLPIAGIILALRPLVGGIDAERTAIAIAPMLPLLPLMFALTLIVRRLVDPRAYPLAFFGLFFAGSATGMFMPARIDHHGWQLALAALAIAGLVDPKRARGGVVVGIATALSLAIGLEMLIYLALAAVAIALLWVFDVDERRRMASFAASLGGGTALGFLLFASYANRGPVCDALSPVWLSDALLGSALLLGLAILSPADWKRRLMLAVLAGIVVAVFHAMVWPHCLTRLEGVSPEVEQLWLSHVREARPIYRHGPRIAALVAALPVTGVIGWILLAIVRRRDPKALGLVIAAALACLVATLLLLWQTRTGPAAQIFAVPGAAALTWIAVPWAFTSRHALVRTLGTSAILIIGFGAAGPLATAFSPPGKSTPRERQVNLANKQCNSLWGMRFIAREPKGLVFTFVDLGPRLITVTHHDAITGPYHRNGEQIGDVMKAFRGSEAQARAIIADKYKSDYLLICPNMSTSTIFRSETPQGFYSNLERGRTPGWLQPVPLAKGSPFRMWRVQR